MALCTACYIAGVTALLDWTVPGSNIPVGARFSAPVHTDPGVHTAFYTWGAGHSGVKRSGRGVDHQPI
jgi:hypothetical protein